MKALQRRLLHKTTIKELKPTTHPLHPQPSILKQPKLTRGELCRPLCTSTTIRIWRIWSVTSSAWTTSQNSIASALSASNAGTSTRVVSRAASTTRLPHNPCSKSFAEMTTTNFCCRKLGKQLVIWSSSGISVQGTTRRAASSHLTETKISAFMRNIYGLSIGNICRSFKSKVLRNLISLLSAVKIVAAFKILAVIGSLRSEKSPSSWRMSSKGSLKYWKNRKKYCKGNGSGVKLRSKKSK